MKSLAGHMWATLIRLVAILYVGRVLWTAILSFWLRTTRSLLSTLR